MEYDSKLPNEATPGTGLASLTRMLRILFFCFLALIIGAFAYYFIFSGTFRVHDHYEAMQLRFGVLQKHAGDTGDSPILQSGKWYWSYPYPIDEVIMVPANKSVSVSTGSTVKAWVSPTGQMMGAAARELRNGVDGYLVAGDMHIFHAEWVVSYRVDNAADYYLNFYDDTKTTESFYLPSSEQVKAKDRLRGHELIIRNLLADAVLAETACWTTEDLIRASKVVEDEQGAQETVRIEDRVRGRLMKMVDEVGLGIELQTVTLVGLYQPPTAALQAFNQVNASERNRQTMIQRAETEANQVMTQAVATSDRLVNEAKAYQETVVSKLQAQAQYFQSIQREFKQNPRSTMTVLYADALGEMLANVPNKYVLHQKGKDGKQELRLQIAQIPEPPKNAAVTVTEEEGEPASAQAGME
ncbi:MAG: hypothetical protein MJ106_02990 [Lentisphaeria bacterium]|nr:hypothetical protein [Lentisphaeria bacterium]